MGIFHLHSYREIIERKLQEFRSVRGYKAHLCKVMGIQQSQLSQVLAGKLDLNLDQGSLLCDEWQLDDLESEYFLNLIQLKRASSASLKMRIQKRLEELIRSSNIGVVQLGHSHSLDETRKAERFFTSWLYPAVMGAIAIPSLLDENDIAKRLDISPRIVQETLQELQEMNLVKFENGKFQRSVKGLAHISRQVKMLIHSELRAKAHTVYASGDTEMLRLGQLSVCAKERFLDFRQRIGDLIADYRREMSGDPIHQEIVVFNVDFFRIGRSSDDTSTAAPKDGIEGTPMPEIS